MDAALRGEGELAAPVELLSTVVLDHLAHEEREVLPLVEQHLTRAQWRAFLLTERGRRRPRDPGGMVIITHDEAVREAIATPGPVRADRLIADADGIYYPGSYNDRLILGLSSGRQFRRPATSSDQRTGPDHRPRHRGW